MRFDRTTVLMYHRVLPDSTVAFGVPSCYRIRGTAVTPTELCSHLDWLATQQIPVLPLIDVVAACARQERPPPGVVLTFDDGYLEWLTVVAPQLQARRMVATFFISTAMHAEAARAHPIDEYYFLLDHARFPTFKLKLPDGTPVSADLRVPEDKRALVRGALKQYLARGTPIEQTRLLSTLRSTLQVDLPADLPATLYMKRSAWAQLTRSGSQVEAHGHSHRRLTELSDAELENELAHCLAIIRQHVAEIRCFAYPDGAYDDRAVARVATIGLCCALTVVPGDVTAQSSLFRLPRYFVRGGAQLEEVLSPT